MAAIDKIYGTKDQHDELLGFISQNNPEALRYLYIWDGEWYTDGENHPISCFPESIDRWLLKNCKIDWVVAYIKDQYGE